LQYFARNLEAAGTSRPIFKLLGVMQVCKNNR